jgi:cyanuric acid amidohydrolase
VTPTTVHRFPIAAPDDVSALVHAFDTGLIAPERVVALWCKTEGNGLRNDWTRALADLSLRAALARRLGVSAEAMRERVVILASGGSEGVVSPHLTVIATTAPGASSAPGLVVGAAAQVMAADSLASESHAQATAAMIRSAMQHAGIANPDDVGLVLVRAPTDPARRGHDPLVRAAGALGTALALGDIAPADLSADAFCRRIDLHATRAFVVARHDGFLQQVLVLGNAPGGNPALKIAHGTLADPIDSPAVARILATLGLTAAPQLSTAEASRVVAVISKGDAPLSGAVRGLRHVMSIDNDVAMHRHARAAYGTLLSSIIGHTACLVSGGAEHQGPAEGGFAAIIARTQS